MDPGQLPALVSRGDLVRQPAGYDTVAAPNLGHPVLVGVWRTGCYRFAGIRRGIVTIDPGDGRTRWWSRPASSSYRLLALAPGGQDALAVRSDHDGSAWLVRAVHGGADHRLQILRPADKVPVSVVTWSNDGITLEGLLAAAAGAGPQRLLVLLHGGPVGGLVCGEHPDPSAWVRRASRCSCPISAPRVSRGSTS